MSTGVQTRFLEPNSLFFSNRSDGISKQPLLILRNSKTQTLARESGKVKQWQRVKLHRPQVLGRREKGSFFLTVKKKVRFHANDPSMTTMFPPFSTRSLRRKHTRHRFEKKSELGSRNRVQSESKPRSLPFYYLTFILTVLFHTSCAPFASYFNNAQLSTALEEHQTTRTTNLFETQYVISILICDMEKIRTRGVLKAPAPTLKFPNLKQHTRDL